MSHLAGSVASHGIVLSTVLLGLGLLISLACRQSSARAHHVLLLSMIAALVVPGLFMLVSRLEWGLMVAPWPKTAQVPPGPMYVAPDVDLALVVQSPSIADVPAVGAHLPGPRPAASGSRGRGYVLLVSWGLLTVACVVRLATAIWLVRDVIRKANPYTHPDLETAIRHACDRLGVHRPVQVRTSSSVRSPSIWCWQRDPVLLLPDQTPGAMVSIDWVGVVCHELAHYARRDHLAGLFAEAFLCLLPWHPLAWLAKRRLIALSEQACDDWVLASGQEGIRYAQSLLDLVPQLQPALVPAVATGRKALALRVRRILDRRTGNPRVGLAWALGALAAVGSLTAGLALAQTRPASGVQGPGPVPSPGNGLPVTVTVFDPQAQPVPGLVVTEQYTHQQVITDDRGSARFRAPEHLNEFAFSAIDRDRGLAGGTTWLRDREAGPAPLEMRPAEIVTGVVLDPQGRPAAGARVLSLLTMCNTLADAQGRFTLSLRRLPQHGDILIARDLVNNLAEVVRLPDQGQVSDVTIRLRPGLTLTGTFVDPGHDPVTLKQAAIFLTDAQTRGTIAIPIELPSVDGQGVCRLAGLPARGENHTYRFVVLSTDGAAGVVELGPSGSDVGTVDLGRILLYRGLRDSELPDLAEVDPRLNLASARDKRLLVCFWDVNQPSSRDLLVGLADHADSLKRNDVQVVVIQLPKTDWLAVRQWLVENFIPFDPGFAVGPQEALRARWNVRELPWMILTDTGHMVRADGFKLEDLSAALREDAIDTLSPSLNRHPGTGRRLLSPPRSAGVFPAGDP